MQTDFRDSVLVEEATWQAIIIIPKGGGEYHGIGIVGVACKSVEVILNIRFTTSITYHNSLYGFRAGRGTGNTTLEVKILQQVTAMREVVLHVIFLDLHKLYNALDKPRCLEILEGYGVGPRVLRLLRRYWAQLQMVARAGGVLWSTLPQGERRNTGGTIVAHHIKCGGGHSGPLLGVTVSRSDGGAAARTTSQGR